MLNLSRILPFQESDHGYIGPATVLDVDTSGKHARIQHPRIPKEPVTWATIAAGSEGVFPGDEVLVLGEDMNHLYLIAILETKWAREDASLPRPSKISTQDGAYALIEQKNESSRSESLRLFSKKKELLFEYDSQTNTGRIFVQSGNLEFVTQEGDITLHSARDIRLDGEHVELTGHSGVTIGIRDVIGRLGSAILLKPRKLKIHSPEMDLVSQRGSAVVDEMRYTGKTFLGKLHHLHIVAHKAERAFRTVLETAENVYTTVKSLSQLRAGRKRTIVDSTYHLKTGRSILKSDKDFKIKGEKIHLG